MVKHVHRKIQARWYSELIVSSMVRWCIGYPEMQEAEKSVPNKIKKLHFSFSNPKAMVYKGYL